MNKIKLPLELNILYNSEEEKKKKIEAITSLLKEIWDWNNNIDDLNNIKKLTQILKNKISKKTYIFYWVITFIFLFILFNTTIWLWIFNWKLKTNIYLWQNHGYWYYINNLQLEYWEFKIKWCNINACISDKWMVLKRLIDYYY